MRGGGEIPGNRLKDKNKGFQRNVVDLDSWLNSLYCDLLDVSLPNLGKTNYLGHSVRGS